MVLVAKFQCETADADFCSRTDPAGLAGRAFVRNHRSKNGDEFSLEVEYFDEIATGQTQVPAPPTATGMKSTTTSQ